MRLRMIPVTILFSVGCLFSGVPQVEAMAPSADRASELRFIGRWMHHEELAQTPVGVYRANFVLVEALLPKAWKVCRDLGAGRMPDIALRESELALPGYVSYAFADIANETLCPNTSGLPDRD